MIKFEEVYQTYNGATGCMCGCKGRYSFPTHTPDALVAEGEGRARDENDISNRRVKLALNKVNKALEAGDPNAGVDYDSDGLAHCAYVDDGRRTTVVYLLEAELKLIRRARERKMAKAAAAA